MEVIISTSILLSRERSVIHAKRAVLNVLSWTLTRRWRRQDRSRLIVKGRPSSDCIRSVGIKWHRRAPTREPHPELRGCGPDSIAGVWLDQVGNKDRVDSEGPNLRHQPWVRSCTCNARCTGKIKRVWAVNVARDSCDWICCTWVTSACGSQRLPCEAPWTTLRWYKRWKCGAVSRGIEGWRMKWQCHAYSKDGRVRTSRALAFNWMQMIAKIG